MNERALVFSVGGEDLIGIVHAGAQGAQRGVLIVVGGPQYRVGSHRQFLLLARRLAAAGIPVFRFDYRGMGDADGGQRTFEDISEDLRAAIDVFMAEQPALKSVVLWGLCDAASAALMYAGDDRRVDGLVLLNPWVRTVEGLARARLRHYYLQRLFSRDFWAGLFRGQLRLFASLRGLGGAISRARSSGAGASGEHSPRTGTLPERMAAGWKRFPGSVLLILSGDDLTAREFTDTAAQSPAWAGLLQQARVRKCELADANHTFSREDWRERVTEWTLNWLRQERSGAQ
ncbi:MAG: hydrolase 1, exosortase A system-associated [Gammaproteobacteria bacterium]|jgi:exosortase A-associated hydrolase 1|nr:hydrolase 1, exosortase A system-associated [Gammaproteobacteria bacterium]